MAGKGTLRSEREKRETEKEREGERDRESALTRETTEGQRLVQGEEAWCILPVPSEGGPQRRRWGSGGEAGLSHHAALPKIPLSWCNEMKGLKGTMGT